MKLSRANKNNMYQLENRNVADPKAPVTSLIDYAKMFYHLLLIFLFKGHSKPGCFVSMGMWESSLGV